MRLRPGHAPCSFARQWRSIATSGGGNALDDRRDPVRGVVGGLAGARGRRPHPPVAGRGRRRSAGQPADRASHGLRRAEAASRHVLVGKRERAMNVIDVVKEDHQKVKQLFKSFESAKEEEQDDSCEQIARQICQELTVHAAVEEQLFYPAVDAKASADEEAEDRVKEADEEHRLVKALVAEIQRMRASDDHFQAKVKVLKDLVDHHVEEEEGELMPRPGSCSPARSW